MQTPVQKYWHDLLKYVKEGSLTPDMVSISFPAHLFKHHATSTPLTFAVCSQMSIEAAGWCTEMKIVLSQCLVVMILGQA